MNRAALQRSPLWPALRAAGQWFRAQQRRFHLQWPPVGTVRLGSLRRVTPISKAFARDRGTSITRYYVEGFLSEMAGDIRGLVLEFGDDRYTRMFGGRKVMRRDILSVDDDPPGVPIVADVTKDVPIESGTYDCIICTQTLQMIYDLRAAMATLFRILKPGGVLLATSHGISPVTRHSATQRWGDYWHFTTMSKRRLFEEFFPSGNLTVRTYGNVLSSIGFLHGLAAEELRTHELDCVDPDFELVICVRAVKPQTPSPGT